MICDDQPSDPKLTRLGLHSPPGGPPWVHGLILIPLRAFASYSGPCPAQLSREATRAKVIGNVAEVMADVYKFIALFLAKNSPAVSTPIRWVIVSQI